MSEAEEQQAQQQREHHARMEKAQCDMLDRVEQYQRMFVIPIVERVEERIVARIDQSLKPIVEEHTAIRNRLERLTAETTHLRSMQSKALVGWGVIAVVAATVAVNTVKGLTRFLE